MEITTMSSDGGSYGPLRFHVQNLIDDVYMWNQVRPLLDETLSLASRLIFVISVTGRLLLRRRSACAHVWTHGPNLGRCSKIREDYDGERCAELPDFTIPEDHLEAFEVYGETSSVPLRASSIRPGTGITNADYILYVGMSARFCKDSLAYTAVCQLGVHDRPTAGYVNICPSFFDFVSDRRTAQMLLMHEIFHALGFSGKYFNKFKHCQLLRGRLECFERKNVVVTDSRGLQYLNLPTVKKKLCESFAPSQSVEQCSRLKGAPLQRNTTNPSHWDPEVLPKSLMVPKFWKGGGGNCIVCVQTNETCLDPVSFGTLHDAGWYRVDFSALEENSTATERTTSFRCTEMHLEPLSNTAAAAAIHKSRETTTNSCSSQCLWSA